MIQTENKQPINEISHQDNFSLYDKGEVIYPATFDEHFYGWHGGNWKDSLPGRRINPFDDF